MTLEEAEAKIETAVYKATVIYERLEGKGLVRGNGHHMRQQIASHASRLLRERWQQPEKPKLGRMGIEGGGEDR